MSNPWTSVFIVLFYCRFTTDKTVFYEMNDYLANMSSIVLKIWYDLEEKLSWIFVLLIVWFWSVDDKSYSALKICTFSNQFMDYSDRVNW